MDYFSEKSMKRIAAISIIIIASALFSADVPVSTATQNQTEPSSAGIGGKTAVAWTDSRAGTSNLHIYGDIVQSDGSLNGTIPICVATLNQSDVVVAGGAQFLVSWIDNRTGSPQIYAIQLNQNASMGTEFILSSNTDEKAFTAASNIGDDIMVIWQETSTYKRIRGRRVAWSGSAYSAAGSVFDISPAGYNTFYADIAGGSSEYLVVWTDSSFSTGHKVVAQRVSSSGAIVGDTTVIAVYPGYITYAYLGEPAVAWDGSQWLVVWQYTGDGSDYNIYGRYVNSSGVASGSVFNIATTSSNETRPDIAFDGIGFFVVWQATIDYYPNIFGARVIGTSVGTIEALSEGGYHNEQYPCISWNGSYYDLFWQDNRISGSSWDIYMSRWEQTPWNGPTATPIRPPDRSGSTCLRQEAVMFLHDDDGINTSTIQFNANGTNVGIGDPRLTYVNDTLRFAPTTDWPQNTWLSMCLNRAEDMMGIDIVSPVCWEFMVDRTNPVWGASTPDNHELVGGGSITLSIEVTDAGCGVSTDSMGFRVMGIWYFYGTSPAVSWDGASMHFNSSAEGIYFDPFDTFTVCATVRDKAEYCGYNQIDYCWEFYTQGNRIYGNVNLSDVGDDSGVLVRATYGDSVWSASTDFYGDYSIPCVQEVAGIQLRASKAGYSDSTVVVDMSLGGEVEVNFTLNPTLIIYESDFEANNGGLDTIRFGSNPNDWRWGTPTAAPGSAHGGTKCWGTILNGNYSNQSKSRLVLGPIYLPESSLPMMTWWQWYRFQAITSGSYHDGGNVKLWLSPPSTSADSTILILDRAYDVNQSQYNFLIAYQTSFAGNSFGNYWHEVNVDLSPWEGEEVYISWDFGSSNNNVEAGWFIDDVTIIASPSNVLSFAIDCSTWSVLSPTPPDTIVSTELEKIVVTNTGNVPLDLALVCDSIPYFTLYDSLAYGYLGLWAIFNDEIIPPRWSDFGREDFFSHVFRYADADTFGTGGFGIYPHPDSTENLWFRLDTPQFFPIDTFTIKVLIRARQSMD